MLMFRSMLSVLLITFSFVFGVAALAQDGSFYKNKNIMLVIGFNPGGGFDTYGRTVAQYWGKHIPGGPKFIVQNMPGAGSLKSAQHLYKVAKQDGSVLGLANASLAANILLKPGKVVVDLREFKWIGSPARVTNTTVVSPSAPVQTLEDLKTKELIIGGAGGTSVLLPRAAQKILGLKIKVIAGYRGTSGGMLAMEQGEVQGATLPYSSLMSGFKDWVNKNKAKVLVQYALTPNPALPGVPKIIDLAKTEKQRTALRFLFIYQEMGRPFYAPPGVPDARVKLLRTSFAALVKDPAFRQDAERRGLSVAENFPTGEELEKFVAELYATPKEVVSYVRSLELHQKKKRKKKKN
jgi:tripartite-type tricarboxylate transporter receptor subunit TctC